MAKRIDAITRRKLMLVKQLYQQGVIRAVPGRAPVDRILSVIAFDLAAETLLKAVVAQLDPTKPPSKTFDGLVQQCEALVTKPLPQRTNLMHVHSLRNDAQHKARYPTDLEVSDCRTYIRDFLNRVVSDLWRLSLDKISLSEAVQHDEVRKLLIEGEAALAKKDYRLGVERSSEALAVAMGRVKSAMVGRSASFTRGIMVERGRDRVEADRDLLRTLERMRETLLYVSLGMNYAEYVRYKEVAGHVTFTVSGPPHHHQTKEDLTADDAAFALGYAVDTILQIESYVGDLEEPFGLGRGYW